MDFKALEIEQLLPDLTKFKSACLKHSEHPNSKIQEICQHLLTAKGKHLRPGLLLITSYLIDSQPTNIDTINAAASIELVHVGSLHHDDVIDASSTRRGKTSINHEWDNKTAILSGDYLLGKASEIASDISIDVAKILSETISALCVGQMLELFDLFNENRTTVNYLKAIEGKTATLFASSCKLGVIKADEVLQNQLWNYGYNLGMSFQLIDDILDYTQPEEVLGKPCGNDIKEGNLSLPAIYVLEENPKIKEEVASLFKANGTNTAPDEALLEKITGMIKSTDAINRTKILANEYCEKAKLSIEESNTSVNSQIKQKLIDIVNLLQHRIS